MRKTIPISIGAMSIIFSQFVMADEPAVIGEQPQPHAHDINFGGSIDFNYRVTDYDKVNKDKKGDAALNKFKLTIDGAINDIQFSAQYRWYSYQDVLHHAWAGYNLNETSKVQVGVTQVPFGILPYVDNSYWFGPLYYLGLQDDYDAGVKYAYDDGSLSMHLAFFKNEEWGDSSKAERYSLDIVRSGDQQNEESNQLNARIAYKINHKAGYSSEVGFSAMGGQLYNRTTMDNGDRWAAAVHLLGNYDAWTAALQATRYEYNPENPQGVSNNSVQFGGFADTYLAASEANVYTMNIVRKFNVALGKVEEVSCYSDYTIVEGGNTVEDTQLHVLGCSFGAGPVYTYVDFNRSKNFVWIDGDAIGQAPVSEGWQTMFNLNVGYYF